MAESTSDAWKVLVPRNSMEKSKQRKQQKDDARLLRQSPLPISHRFDKSDEPLTQEDQSTMSTIQRDYPSPYAGRTNPWVSSKQETDDEEGDELANQDDELVVRQVNRMKQDADMEYQIEQVCKSVCRSLTTEIQNLSATVEKQRLEIEDLKVQLHQSNQSAKNRHEKYLSQVKMLFENQQTLDDQLAELRSMTNAEKLSDMEAKIQELTGLINLTVTKIK